jgi:hypothetical protein
MYINFQPDFRKTALDSVAQNIIAWTTPIDPSEFLRVEVKKIPEYERRVREAAEAYSKNPNKKTLEDLNMAEGYLARALRISNLLNFYKEYPYTYRALAAEGKFYPKFYELGYFFNKMFGPIPSEAAALGHVSGHERWFRPEEIAERLETEQKHYMKAQEKAVEEIIEGLLPLKKPVDYLADEKRRFDIEQEKKKRMEEMKRRR